MISNKGGVRLDNVTVMDVDKDCQPGVLLPGQTVNCTVTR